MDNRKNLIIITIFFVFVSVLLYFKCGNILVDFQRECYISFALNNDKTLIKDLYLIYGFFGYFANTLVFKLFPNINALLIEAHLLSYIVAILFYFILLKFNNKFTSLVFTLFFILLSIFSDSAFSFVLPYSYSTLWSVVSVYGILFAILYCKSGLIFFLLGLAAVNKFEYFIIAFCIVLFHLIKNKKIKTLNWFYILICPLINLFYLFFNKISLSDVLLNLNYIKIQSSTEAIKSFYLSMGVFFNNAYVLYSLKLLATVLISGFISYKFYKHKKNISSLLILFILFVFININMAFNLALLVAVVLYFILLNKNKITHNDTILLLFGILLTSKGIFALNSINYSNFGFFIVIFFIYNSLSKIIDKNWVKIFFASYLMFLSIKNINYTIEHPKSPLKTNFGKIFVNKYTFKTFKETNDYISQNVVQKDGLVVLPEGIIFNLLNNIDYDFFNTSFTPLDFQTFGEKNLISKLRQNKTKYVIFYPRNTKEYGAHPICQEYAVDFCTYVMDNYQVVKKIDNVVVYKLNEKE